MLLKKGFVGMLGFLRLRQSHTSSLGSLGHGNMPKQASEPFLVVLTKFDYIFVQSRLTFESINMVFNGKSIFLESI